MAKISPVVFQALAAAVQSGQPISQDTVKKAKDLASREQELVKGFDKAKAEFQKASKEPNAGKYKTYADLQTEYIDTSNKAFSSMASFLDEAVSQLSKSGFNQEEWATKSQQFNSALQEMRQQLVTLQTRIDAAKKGL
jgi:hypothetical protein